MFEVEAKYALSKKNIIEICSHYGLTADVQEDNSEHRVTIRIYAPKWYDFFWKRRLERIKAEIQVRKPAVIIIGYEIFRKV